VYAGVAGFKLEQGGARFDVNVSIRFEENGVTEWPPLSEIKNLNSFRALEEAVAYESARLWDEWESGGELRTRKGKITVGWSPEQHRTYVQRTKEEVNDYRYFPEPDLVSLSPDRAMVERIRAALPEMPGDRRARFASQYGLSEYDARILVSDRALADWFEAAAKAAPAEAKQVAHWVMRELIGHLKASNTTLAAVKVAPEQLGGLVGLIAAGTVGTTAAKTVFAEMLRTGGAADAIVRAKGLSQVSDETAIAAAVDAAIAANAKAVADYRAGNQRALAALFGPVMKQLAGRADPAIVNRLIAERLK
jgi:aspartyl-tRNA(Asn)/glutamyl-tRNA(Gln) amidotransferase subunit B